MSHYKVELVIPHSGPLGISGTLCVGRIARPDDTFLEILKAYFLENSVVFGAGMLDVEGATFRVGNFTYSGDTEIGKVNPEEPVTVYLPPGFELQTTFKRRLVKKAKGSRKGVDLSVPPAALNKDDIPPTADDSSTDEEENGVAPVQPQKRQRFQPAADDIFG